MRVTLDTSGFQEKLGSYRKQLPYAAASALTLTAKDSQQMFTELLPQRIDRPSPFTMKAVGIKPARKNSLEASVHIKPRQATYLAKLETGGTFDAGEMMKSARPNSAIPVPRQIKLNKYGSIGRGRLRRLVEGGAKKKARTFVATINGKAGVWKEYGPGQRKLKLLAAFTDSIKLKPQLGFVETVTDYANRRIRKRFGKQLAKAIRTAR